ncbi:caspase, EACC1-associated type [Streptomyces aurantiogriseus]|uniref:Peptidase C14 caspase domain-containing protein n=1 Tax=Streptomyces aurantiogriseus TaxID=66870 RepID=A0A918FDZ9_9ACTN|nr:caspase family protein [Streptomyces aurantiogriseus]GGR26878.1 hypothetical protein GCM10010251_48820 [Streptomyces aurantiogriseus]
MSALPDPSTSRAVLIGTSEYTSPNLDGLPAVAANLKALADLLCAPDVWGLPAQNCVVVTNPTTPRELVHPIAQAAAEATDTLLVYYAGHGLTMPMAPALHLSLRDSEPNLSYTCVSYESVREQLVATRARRRIVVLDCCFSGHALGMASGDPSTRVVEEAGGFTEGTYLMAAAGSTKKAISVPGEPYTAFTAELLRLLSDGLPGGDRYLDLDTLFQHVDARLRAKRRPEPQRRVHNTAGRVAFHNRAFVADVEAPTADTPAPPLTAGATAVVLRTLIESARADRSARLATAARGPAAEVAELACLLPKAGMSYEVRDFLEKAARDRPVREIVSLVAGLHKDERHAARYTSIVLTEAAGLAVPDVADLIAGLPADDADTLIRHLSQWSPIDRLVELTRTLRARGLRAQASALIGGAAGGRSDLVGLFSVLVDQGRDGDVELLLRGSENWSRRQRRSIDEVLRTSSLDRTTWRPLLRRHAFHSPKSIRAEFVRTYAVLLALSTTLSTVDRNVHGVPRTVVLFGGATLLFAYGVHAAHRIVLTHPNHYLGVIGGATFVAGLSLPIASVFQYAVTGVLAAFVWFLHRRLRDTRRVRAWYSEVIAGRRLNSPWAMHGLASLEAEEGNVETARRWYRRAADTDAVVAPRAMLDLGLFEERQGDLDAARAWFTKAAAQKDTATAARAMVHLGILEERQGAWKAAADCYHRAIETERLYTAWNVYILDLLPSDGTITGPLRDRYARSVTKRADAAPWAMHNLGLIEERQGNADAARDWYSKVAALGNAEAASRASEGLARLSRPVR